MHYFGWLCKITLKKKDKIELFFKFSSSLQVSLLLSLSTEFFLAFGANNALSLQINFFPGFSRYWKNSDTKEKNLFVNESQTDNAGRLCFGRHSSKQHFLGIQLCVRLNQLFNLGHYSNKSLSYTTTFWAWSVIIHLIYSIAGYSIYIGLEIV